MDGGHLKGLLPYFCGCWLDLSLGCRVQLLSAVNSPQSAGCRGNHSCAWEGKGKRKKREKEERERKRDCMERKVVQPHAFSLSLLFHEWEAPKSLDSLSWLTARPSNCTVKGAKLQAKMRLPTNLWIAYKLDHWICTNYRSTGQQTGAEGRQTHHCVFRQIRSRRTIPHSHSPHSQFCIPFQQYFRA